jgi:hypothetical protein
MSSRVVPRPLGARPLPLRDVESSEEEWRTDGRSAVGHHGKRSFGRVCLWIRLVCDHNEQRMVRLDARGNYLEPRRVRCDQC